MAETGLAILALGPLFAHNGKLDAAGATTFAWLMAALGTLLAGAVVAARVRSGQRPYLAGCLAGAPFVLLACWHFGFAAANRLGGDPRSLGWVMMAGFPLSLLVVMGFLQANRNTTPDRFVNPGEGWKVAPEPGPTGPPSSAHG